MDWLKQIAPTIATALGGPLAGMAVSAVSKAIGVDPDKVEDIISNNKLTADQVAQIKIAEIELAKQAQELGLNFEKLAVDDRKSARDMQKETRDFLPRLLAVSVTLGYFGIIAFVLMSGLPMNGSEVLLMLLGTLSAGWTGVMAFYFGSSSGSQKKDSMIYNSTPKE